MRGLVLLPVLGAFALAIAIVSCSSDPKRPPPGSAATNNPIDRPPVGAPPDASTDGPPPDGGDAGGECNAIANTGVLVTQEAVIGDAPPHTGGALSDGFYDLTAVRVYVGAGGVGGPTEQSWQASIVIQKNRIDRVLVIKDSGTGKS